MLRPLPSESSGYILRHATPDRTVDVPNRERPLSELGRQQAQALVPFLLTLELTVVYSSPFVRALETVRPFCETAGLEPVTREDLGESGDKEPFDQVTDRMIGAVTAIAGMHRNEDFLICTHGGCIWGTLRHFDPTFNHDDYERIRNPDVFRLAFTNNKPSLDTSFTFDEPSPL